MIIKIENEEKMARMNVDLILHPVRLRILLLVTGTRLTAQQITQMMPDVPQATLYRQIHQLVDGGLLIIDETRPVRGGVVEKVYTVKTQNVRLTAEDIATLSREDHLQYFTIFFTQVLHDFERYLQQEQIDFAKDVRYHQIPLYLSESEFQKVTHALTTIIQAQQNNHPTSERRRRLFTSIIIPDVDTTSSAESNI